MRRKCWVALLPLLLLGMACQEAEEPAEPAPAATTSTEADIALSDVDAAKIREAYQAFTTAAETDEFRRLGRFFTEDAVWMPHAGPAVQGRPAIEGWFTVGAVDFEHQIVELLGRDDLAYTRASFTLVLDIPGFTACNGDALAIWKRQPNGEWLIANYAQTFDTACSGTQ